MKTKYLISTALLLLLVAGNIFADNNESNDKRYFIMTAKPTAELWDSLVSNPEAVGDPTVAARDFIEGLDGAELIAYFLYADKPMNVAIFSVSNGRDASAVVYQRMATGLVEEIEISELIPGPEFAAVMETAKSFREGDKYSK